MEEMVSNTNAGDLLALIRKKAGLTQVELSEQANVSRSMVAQIETGERRPSKKLLRMLCHAMNISEDDERRLFLAFGFRPTGATVEQIGAFLRADKDLTSEQADRIAALVREAYEKALEEEE